MKTIRRQSGLTVNPQRATAEVDGRASRWDEHREQRRLELVRQIRQIVHQHGPSLSMGEIASELGTSKSILYRYFKDKTALQVALGDYVLGRARGLLAAAASSNADPRQAIGAMVDTYLEVVERSRNVFLFVNRPQTAESERTLRVFVRQVEEIVNSMLAPMVAGTAAAARVNLWAAALVGLVRAAADDWVNSPPESRLPRAALAHDLSTIMWHGASELVAESNASRRP